MYRACRYERGAPLHLDAVSVDDLDASGGHRARDLLDWDPEDRSEFLGDGLAVPLARGEDDIPRGSGRDRRYRSAHDLAVTFDLNRADSHPDAQVVAVVPLPADDERAPRQELAGLRLLRHLLGEDPVRTPARKSRGPC